MELAAFRFLPNAMGQDFMPFPVPQFMNAGSWHENVQIPPRFDCRYRAAAQGVQEPCALRGSRQVGKIGIVLWGCLRVAFSLLMLAPYFAAAI